ncbi:MAG: hypothetical protein AAF770_00785 [Bacteroidota bacterium]
MLYRNLYPLLLFSLSFNMIVAQDLSQVQISFSPPNHIRSTTPQKNQKKQYKPLRNTLSEWATPIGITLLSVIPILIYRYNKQVKTTETISKSDKQKINDSSKASEKQNEVNKQQTINTQTKKSKQGSQVETSLPKPKKFEPWDVKRYDLWHSSVIKKNSPIVTSGWVTKSYYSYASSQDIFQKLNPQKTLFVNAANGDVSFGLGGTNGFLSDRIKEKQKNKANFNELSKREKWGIIKDHLDKPWNKNQLEVGEFVVSIEPNSQLRILHLLAPCGTEEGLDKLRKGVEKLCVYAYEKQYEKLILCAAGTAIYAGSNPKVGNGAYQASIGGVEDFLQKQASKPQQGEQSSQRFQICLNWWASGIVEHVPPIE